MAKVEIYSHDRCGYCKRAKALLEELGVEYVEYNIYEDADAMNVMREGGYRTVPQIFIDDVHIGGHDDLVEMRENGALESLVEG